MAKIQKILQNERKRTGLTYSDVARNGRLSVSDVWKILNGSVQKPSYESVEAIVRGMGQTMKWLAKEME